MFTSFLRNNICLRPSFLVLLKFLEAAQLKVIWLIFMTFDWLEWFLRNDVGIMCVSVVSRGVDLVWHWRLGTIAIFFFLEGLFQVNFLSNRLLLLKYRRRLLTALILVVLNSRREYFWLDWSFRLVALHRFEIILNMGLWNAHSRILFGNFNGVDEVLVSDVLVKSRQFLLIIIVKN